MRTIRGYNTRGNENNVVSTRGYKFIRFVPSTSRTWAETVPSGTLEVSGVAPWYPIEITQRHAKTQQSLNNFIVHDMGWHQLEENCGYVSVKPFNDDSQFGNIVFYGIQYDIELTNQPGDQYSCNTLIPLIRCYQDTAANRNLWIPARFLKSLWIDCAPFVADGLTFSLYDVSYYGANAIFHSKGGLYTPTIAAQLRLRLSPTETDGAVTQGNIVNVTRNTRFGDYVYVVITRGASTSFNFIATGEYGP